MAFHKSSLALGLAAALPALVAGQSPSSVAASSVPIPSGTGTLNTAQPSVSLLSVNPTAVPLSAIVSGTITESTIALTTTFVAGVTPTYMSAPTGLGSLATLVPANYPPLDKVPPTDSPEVQGWIQDVINSGVTVPGFGPTNPGGCPNNTEALADPSRCWWTCGGCTRDVDITTCPDKLTWGLTYDDGPGPNTPNLLQYLNNQNLTATFFTIGSRAISRPAMLQDEYMAGHQIGVHTWSHPMLTTLSNEQIIAELGWTKKLLKEVLGVTPNTMRPPFGDIDDRVRAISIAMGLTPIIWTRISPMATFDTGDFNVPGGLVTVQQVLQNWDFILNNATMINTGFIVLEHDLFPQTVDIATGYVLPDALAFQPKLTLKPVIDCMGQPKENAYIETNQNSTNPPAASRTGAAIFESGNPGALSTDISSLSQASATGAAASGGGSDGGSGSGSSSGALPTMAGFSTLMLGVFAGVATVLL